MVATMDDLDKLPPDLTWQTDGHLTDVVLASVADGEAGIVEKSALSHLDHCDHCATRLGAEALLSAHAGEILMGLTEPMPAKAVAKVKVEKKSEKASETNGRPALPKGALAGALVVAAVGATPSFIDMAPRLPGLLRDVGRGVVLLVRGADLVVRSDAGTTLAWVSSLFLLISGLVVSRLSRPGSSKGLAEEGVL